MNNVDIIGEEATVRQIIEDDFSATNGVFEDDSVTKLRQSAFQGKTTLESVFLPNVNFDHKNIWFIFQDCTNLKKAIFPNLIGQINRMFIEDRALTLVDLGYCSDISDYAFQHCRALVTIILRNSSVAWASLNAFDDTKYATNGAGGAYVYVPRNLIASYQAATNWATLYAAHSDMFRALEDYTVDGTTTGEFDETKL